MHVALTSLKCQMWKFKSIILIKINKPNVYLPFKTNTIH